MDNPHVTSKFDRGGRAGHPHAAGHVASPGEVAHPPGGGVDGGHPGGTDGAHPVVRTDHLTGEFGPAGRTQYHPNHHGAMHRGEGAQHPTLHEDPRRGGEAPESHGEHLKHD